MGKFQSICKECGGLCRGPVCPDCTKENKNIFVRKQLLTAAKKKPAYFFQEYDVFNNLKWHDGVVIPDDDGDSIWSHCAWELRNLNLIRVMIPVGESPKLAARALRKIAKEVARSGNDLPF